MTRSGSDRGLSPHPADRLVRELVRTRGSAATGDSEAIVGRLASAPFDPRPIRPRPRERGIVYQGEVLGARDVSAFVHLVRRNVGDEQWSWGTTVEQYVADLGTAARSPEARLAICARRGGHLAAVVAPTAAAVATGRRGPRFEPTLLVVYSADRGIILTGYQVADVDAVAFPEDASWF